MPSKTYGRSPLQDAYLTMEEAERYYDALEQARYARSRQVVTYVTQYADEFERAKAACFAGEPDTIGGHYGLVLKVDAPLCADLDGRRLYEITMRPMHQPRDLAAEERAKQDAALYLAQMNDLPWHPMCRCNVDELLLTLEDGMKVFETIVVNVNEQGEITGIAQDAKLVVAKNAQAAKESTLVDYAAENKLAGKDLTGFQVRTREFQSIT
jgi:hypothetical protein